MSPVFQLALTPFLLTCLGPHQYGVWVLGLMITGAGSLASLGAPTATMKKVAEGAHHNHPLRSPSAVTTILSAASVMSLLGTTLIGGLILGATMMFNHGADPLLASGSFWGMALLFSWLAMIVQETDNVVAASLKGLNRFDLVAKIDIRFRIVWFIAVAGAAYATGEVALCVLAGLIVSIVKLAWKTKVAFRVHGSRLWDRHHFGIDALLQLGRISKWYWLQSLGAFLFNTADRWVIARLFGLEGLATYAICLQLAQFTHGIQASAGQVIIPWASAKAPELKQHVQGLVKVCLHAGLACLVLPAGVALASGEILRLWIGPEFASLNQPLILALLFSYAVLSANIPLHYILVGIGKVRLLTALTIAGGAISLGAGILTSQWGMEAFAMSKSLYGALIILAVVPLARNRYG